MKQLFITIGALLFSSILYGQAGGVGINNNGTAPNASAMLDVESTSKGLLVPRVALTNTTDATTIANGNVTSLLVYNTATIADVVPGYYYWDGTVWKTLGGDADADPNNEIQDLQIVGNNLTITNNGTPTTIDLSPYLDNTDNQNIDSVSLNGTNLTVYIENGTAATVDLSALASDHDWYEVGGTAAPDNINDDIYTQGNVGIGTITPAQPLHVIGQTISERGSNQFAALDASSNYIATFDARDNSGNPQLRFSVVPNTGGALAPKMTIEGSTGNVGIGTTTPRYATSSARALSFSGSGTVGPDMEFIGNNVASSASPFGRLMFINDVSGTPNLNAMIGGYGSSAGQDEGNIRFYTKESGNPMAERVIIDGNGNVGIGTSVPQEKLHVIGNQRLESTNPILYLKDNDATISTDIQNNNIRFTDQNDNPTGIIGFSTSLQGMSIQNRNANGGIHFSVGGTVNNVVINPNGNTGIGITTATTKLDINGDLTIRTITNGSGSDVALVADASGVVKQVAPYVPPGAVMPFAMSTVPNGWLACNGSAVSRTTYADLFAAIGTTYGAGDGSTTFNLPDLRGEFIRGWDNGAGNDPDAGTRTNSGNGTTGDNVGTKQNDAFEDHVHYARKWNQTNFDSTGGQSLVGADASSSGSSQGTLTGSVMNSPTGGAETRPRNIAMNYCIRF